MASAEAHWAAAVRAQRFAHFLLGSFTPDRYPTIATAAFFAASNYAMACIRSRGLAARNEQQLTVTLRAVPAFATPAILLPYLYLKNAFDDAFYLEEGAPWTPDAAMALLEELERLRAALEPLRGGT